MYVYPRGRSNPQGHAPMPGAPTYTGEGTQYVISTNPPVSLSQRIHLSLNLLYYYNEAGLALAFEAA